MTFYQILDIYRPEEYDIYVDVDNDDIVVKNKLDNSLVAMFGKIGGTYKVITCPSIISDI